MPTRPLRARFVQRLSAELRGAAEMGLALLVTAGVASCGGKTGSSGTADGSVHDSGPCAKPGQCAVEAASFEGGVVVEAAQVDSGPPHFDGPFIEAAQADSGPGFDGTAIEAASMDAGTRGFDGTVIEAASAEGGTPGH